MLAQDPGSGLTGLSGWVADVIATLGAPGVALLTLLETVFPPIPSEVVLPLAGFETARGRLSLPAILVAATLGSVVGALVLYALGRRLGEERSRALLCRLPLVDDEDVQRAADWFERRGPYAVLVGRLVPGVRSLISLPAGAQAMPVVRFTLLTTVGSLAWNTALVLAGAALGSQWQRVEAYSDWIDRILVAALVLVVGWFVVRRLRKRRRGGSRRAGERADPGRTTAPGR